VCVCHSPVLYHNGCSDQAEFFAHGFSSTHTALYCKEIRVSPKVRVFPLAVLNSDLENLATAHRPLGDAQQEQSVCCLHCHLAAKAGRGDV